MFDTVLSKIKIYTQIIGGRELRLAGNLFYYFWWHYTSQHMWRKCCLI